jgi:hypothetical protein
MHRFFPAGLPSRRLLLVSCLIIVLAGWNLLERQAAARNWLPQESPLSPLEAETEEHNTADEIPAEIEDTEPASALPLPDDPPPVQAEIPSAEERPPNVQIATSQSAPNQLPQGEPLRAQTSPFLIGAIIAGLLLLAVLIFTRRRQTLQDEEQTVRQPEV